MSIVRQLLRICSAALVVMTMTMLAPAGSASAAVPGLQVVRLSSAPSSNASQTVFPRCPTGKKLIGAGGQINTTAGGRVRVHRITPLGDLSGVMVTGAELGFGTTSNWTVEGYAICANASALPGLELRQAQAKVDSTASKSATISCSTGKKLLGAGGGIVGDTGLPVILDDIVPGLAAATASAFESSLGTSNSWSVAAYAICADSTAQPFGTLEIKTILAGGTSNTVQKAQAFCSSGKQVISAGATIIGEAGKVVIDEITPLGNSVLVVANESAVGSGTPNNWSVGAFAVCATP